MPRSVRYQQIANDLRGRIERGEFAPSGRMPTEAELMKQYDVSRNTARNAVKRLENGGLVDTIATLGTFVRVRHPLTITATQYERERGVSANDAFRDEVKAQRRKSDERFEFQIIAATKEIADRLQVEPDALVVHRKLTLSVDDRPIAIQNSYYPMDIAEGTEIKTPKNIERGTIRVLEEVGHKEVSHADEISTRMPTDEEDRLLRLGAGVPVLEWIRTAYSNKRPVRMTWTIWAGDAVKLEYKLGDLKAAPLP